MNKALKKVVKDWRGCTKCPLHLTRHEMVFYRGNSPCDVLFIGDVPSKQDGIYGEPFIDSAGNLLDNWIEESQQEMCRTLNEEAQRTKSCIYYHNTGSDIYTFGVCNILACKPPELNSKVRPPSKEEAASCSRRLIDTISAANPKVIVLLGSVAKKYHKIPAHLENIPVVELQHPAHVLRQGGIGSYAYDSNLLKLVEALETHLYGQKEEVVSVKKQSTSSKKTTRNKVVQSTDQAAKVRIDPQGARKPSGTKKDQRDQSRKGSR
jgi:uracil-DNA glycosylase